MPARGPREMPLMCGECQVQHLCTTRPHDNPTTRCGRQPDHNPTTRHCSRPHDLVPDHTTLFPRAGRSWRGKDGRTATKIATALSNSVVVVARSRVKETSECLCQRGSFLPLPAFLPLSFWPYTSSSFWPYTQTPFPTPTHPSGPIPTHPSARVRIACARMPRRLAGARVVLGSWRLCCRDAVSIRHTPLTDVLLLPTLQWCCAGAEHEQFLSAQCDGLLRNEM